MSRFRDPSPWDDDDPAIVLMRRALAPRPPVDAPGRPEVPKPPSASTGPVVDSPTAVLSRRERIRELLALVKSGDRAAIDALRKLLP